MTRACDHGIPDGAPCDALDCYNHRAHIPPAVGTRAALIPATLEATQRHVVEQMATKREPQGYEGTVHKPEARQLARDMDALARRDSASGDMTRGHGYVGVREDGSKAPGSVAWPHRPPVMPEQMSEHHEYIPIIMRNPNKDGDPVTLMYQQAQPIGNVPGAVYAESVEARVLTRNISEAAAERATMEEIKMRAREDCRHLSSLEIAERLEMNPAQLRRRAVGRKAAR